MQNFIPRKDARGFILPSFVFESDTISLGAKVLFGLLCDYARDKDYCFPSKCTLAKRLNASLNSVKAWLKQLIKAGFIHITVHLERKREAFYLLCPITSKNDSIKQSNSQNLIKEVSNSDRESNVKLINIKNNTPLPPKLPDDKNKGSERADFKSADKDFADLYANYPKKEAKENAKRAYLSLHRGNKLPPLPEMLKAVAYYSKTEAWLKEGGRYVPQLANFLKAARWEDVPKITEVQEVRRTMRITTREEEYAKIEQDKIQKKLSEKILREFEEFSSFFPRANPVERGYACCIYRQLVASNCVPVIKEKQDMPLLDFLKSIKNKENSYE